MKRSNKALLEHQAALLACRRCPDMIPPVVVGNPVMSPVIQIGQAPGEREGGFGKPFAWTAGKTLFKWYHQIGVDEERVRERIYMAAVCRCFPGKRSRGGDRVPSEDEITRCAAWMRDEFSLLRPRLAIPVGKLAIEQFVEVSRLSDVIGQVIPISLGNRTIDMIALPHPSGASTWHRTEPGKSLLQQALTQLAQHEAWCAAVAG